MRMNKQNALVCLNHFNSLLIGCISRITFYCLIKKVFTPPPTFQNCSNIKTDVLRPYNLGIKHFEIFCNFDVLIKFRHFYGPL